MPFGPERTYLTETRGHRWELDPDSDDGSVNFFAVDADFHNGPRCQKCGYSFCEHCDDGPSHDCPVED